MKKIILIISLGLNLLFVAIFAYDRFVVSPKSGDWKKKWFQARNGIFDNFRPDSTSIVFFGNSLTEGFPLHDMFPNAHVVNRGILANTTTHLKDRIANVIAGHPQKIFIEGGINDIINGVSQDTTLKNIQSIMETVKKLSPNTKIYMQSVLPVTETKFQESVIAINEKLKIFCSLQKIQFIDLYASFVLNGAINPRYTYDGIHLRYEGYVVWKKEIRQFIE